MRNVTLFSFLAILIIAGCAKKEPAGTTRLGLGTDYLLYPENLKGKVKQISETNYWAVEKDGQITKGNLMTWKDLDSVGSTKNWIAYYDSIGNLTAYEVLNDDNSVRTCNKSINENGKNMKWESRINNILRYFYLVQKDASGIPTGFTYYKPGTDSVIGRQIFTYDGNGSFTRIEYFNVKNEKTGHHDFSYSDGGRIIETRYYDKSDSLRVTMKNTYNESGGLLLQETSVERPKTFAKWDMKDLKRDDHDNWIEGYANINDGKFKVFIERKLIYY